MEKIEFLNVQKEKARHLYLKTGDESHLKDMHHFEVRIRKEERKPLERMEWVLVGLMVVTVLAPIVQYFFWKLSHGV